MQKSSCIRRIEKQPLLVIRAEYIAITKDKCQAALISFFEHWHNIKLSQQQKAIQHNDIAEMHGDNRTQDESLYQFHTAKELYEGLMGLFGRNTISKAIEELKKRGYISIHKNPNPRYAFDKTRHFLFIPEKINQDLNRIFHIDNSVSLYNQTCSTVRPNVSYGTTKSDTAIPKISNKITNKISTKTLSDAFSYENAEIKNTVNNNNIKFNISPVTILKKEKIYDSNKAQKSIKDFKNIQEEKIETAILNRDNIKNKKKLNKRNLELYFLATCSILGFKGYIGDNKYATLNSIYKIYSEIGKDACISLLDYSIANWSFLQESLNLAQFKLPDFPSLHYICLRYEPILNLIEKYPEGNKEKNNVISIEEAERRGLI